MSTGTHPQDVAVPADGLTGAEAARLLEEHGENVVPAQRRRGVLWRVGRQLGDPMILLLLAAGTLTAWQGDLADTAIIAVVVVLNTAVGVVQELRAERAIASLQAMAAPRARVVRDGHEQDVAAALVVPGDVMLLEAGDIVPADGEVLDAYQLQTDDSALTGESLGVTKSRGDELFAGTTLARGRSTALVTRTGPASALGRIAGMVASARPGRTPLQRRLAVLGRQLAAAAVAVSVVVMVIALLRDATWTEAAVGAASLAVAAVPESLPAVLTLSLALGAHRMARRSAIVRELRAVETLGSVTLLATDKTGTLTQNRMVVERLWTPDMTYAVSGEGYEPSGRLDADVPGGPDDGVVRLLRDAILCNDATLVRDPEPPQSWRVLGDPTEGALVVVARRGGIDVADVRARFGRRDEVPFDSVRAWMATAHDHDGGFVVVKGAPEVVLSVCEPGPDTDEAGRWAAAESEQGQRVLAIAEAPAQPLGDGLPAGLRLVGLAAMADPPRDGVADVVDTLHDAGIGLVMMTGDSPVTASAIASRLGITGEVVDARTAADAGPLPAGAAVYARVRPEHKLALVAGWQAAGHVVAVTGDGINDGPALRAADIGVAMGQGGTEVARQAADLVLTDDRLETVAHAVEEGRRIYANLQRFLRYALSGGVAEVLYMLVAWTTLWFPPLSPGQILWINMLTHGLPGVALGADPAAVGALKQRPRSPAAAILDRDVVQRIAVGGTLLAVVTAVGAWLTERMGGHGLTAAFLVLGLAQLGVAYAARDRGATPNPFLTATVTIAVLLQAAAVVVGPLRDLLGTEPLAYDVWLVLLGLALLPGSLLIAYDRVSGRRPR